MIISKKALYVLLPVVLTVAACTPSGDEKKAGRTVPAHMVEVAVADIKPVSFQQTISGTLEAITRVRLYNEEVGRITEMQFHEGDRVSRGDILVSLDDSVVRAELDKSVAQREQAEIDLNRLKKLLPNKLASDEDVARAKTALNVALADESLQRARFSRTKIKAPFDGVITERNNEPGDVVALHSHILSLIDPLSLRLKVYISERWISLIHVDDDISISIDALGEQSFNGKVSRVFPTIDPGTRKGIVEISLHPLPEGARAGQLGRATISTRPVERLVIPTLAIHHDLDGAYVYLVNDDKTVHKTKIIKGIEYGTSTEVLSGISKGNRVVVKGFLGLNDGKKVEIVESPTG